jgi:predicted lipoprotein with Yx(FWY)xxD motif
MSIMALMLIIPVLAQQPENTQPTVQVVDHPKLGKILVDSHGMTLYMFTKDKEGTSTCYGQCAFVWPPLLLPFGQPVLAPGIKGSLGLTKRHDNTRQVTYNGMPLYYYIKDKKAGDVTGQGVDNEWFVINPDSPQKK